MPLGPAESLTLVYCLPNLEDNALRFFFFQSFYFVFVVDVVSQLHGRQTRQTGGKMFRGKIIKISLVLPYFEKKKNKNRKNDKRVGGGAIGTQSSEII
jgi:hypothetical protein